MDLICPHTIKEKIALLDLHPKVARYFEKPNPLTPLLKSLSCEEECAIKQVIAIGQWEKVLGEGPFEEGLFRKLLKHLVEIDAFYHEIGGITGYQEQVIHFLFSENGGRSADVKYHSPSFIDMTKETKEVTDAIYAGVEAMPLMAEIYPLGGAADRLHLVDEATKEELPAAKLAFRGKTLLEGMIRDLFAREALYFKFFKKPIVTPIAIMTSQEKNNHQHILEILQEANWFGRPKDTIQIFTQPLVPTVDKEGNWCVASPLKPLFKPGGHGAIWKLAEDKGIFSWLKKLGKKKALLRQINNPLAGLDYGLIAFQGIGVQKDKAFGFASCPRRVHSAEGVNVLIERGEKEIVLTNIEYCDFQKFGIEDQPLCPEEPYSRFSSNTNILFIDLDEVSKAVRKCPFPGLIMNMKKKVTYDDKGTPFEKMFGRLESTMQNLADVFVEEKKGDLKTEKTFITYNHRHKTISTAKKAYVIGGPLQETPENCFYELLRANRELLEECQFQLPPKRTLASYLELGPEFLFLYHPSLGPLYSIIRQKLQRGQIKEGSSLELEIADGELKDLYLDGALAIFAENPIGHFEGGLFHFSEAAAKCRLFNVSVINRGVDWKSSRPFWKNHKIARESLEIHLEGNSEFVAENVSFFGKMEFYVEDGLRMIVSPTGVEGEFAITKEKVKT